MQPQAVHRSAARNQRIYAKLLRKRKALARRTQHAARISLSHQRNHLVRVSRNFAGVLKHDLNDLPSFMQALEAPPRAKNFFSRAKCASLAR